METFRQRFGGRWIFFFRARLEPENRSYQLTDNFAATLCFVGDPCRCFDPSGGCFEKQWKCRHAIFGLDGLRQVFTCYFSCIRTASLLLKSDFLHMFSLLVSIKTNTQIHVF